MSIFVDSIVQYSPRKLVAGDLIKDGILLASDESNELILFWDGEQWEANKPLLNLLKLTDEYALKLVNTDNYFALFRSDVPEEIEFPETIEHWRIFVDQYIEGIN